MTRLQRSAWAGTLGLLIALATWGVGHSTVSGASASLTTKANARAAAPNVILFLTDDMRWDQVQYLPNVNRLLVDRGTTFTNAYGTNSLCCPARATLTTGLYSHNHGVMGNDVASGGGWPTFAANLDQTNLLPDWLQGAGYRTGHLGKHLNGFFDTTPQPGWDHWEATIGRIYNYWRYTVARDGVSVSYTHTYREREMRTELLSWLDEWSEAPQPFFIWAGSLAPHASQGPPQPEPKYADLLHDVQLPYSPAVTEDNILDKPFWTGDRKVPISRVEQLLQSEIESLRSVDDTVGDVVRRLKHLHEYRNTVFIFTSDNGFQVGEHQHVGKNRPYEESIRIPLVISGPGFAAGAKVSALVSQPDITATILDLAGASPGLPQDGVSLVNFEKRQPISRDRVLPIEGGNSGIDAAADLQTDAKHRLYWGARWRHYLYVTDVTHFHEFYDLRTDPYELTNAYLPPGQATPAQTALATWVDQHKDCAGAECNAPLEPTR